MTDLLPEWALREVTLRVAQPEEIAAFASWLVGPENSYISGSNLIIDGGLVRV